MSQAGAIFKLGGRRHRALHPRRRLSCPAGATCATSGSPPREQPMRVVSARWVIPIDRPPSPRGRSRSPTTAWSWPSAGAPRFGPNSRRRPRNGPGARCFPASSTRTATSSCRPSPAPSRAAKGSSPGRRSRWARAGACPSGRTPRAAARRGRRGRRALGTAAIGDVGNALAPRAASAGPAWRGVCLPRAARLARGAHGRRAGRRGAESEPGRRGARLAGRPRLRCAAPHAPYSVGPELLAPASSPPRRAGGARDVDPRGRGRGRGRAAARRQRAVAGRARRRWASIRATRVPGKSPVAYLAALGAFADVRPRRCSFTWSTRAPTIAARA